MAFESPYRGQASLLSPRVRNLVSRGTLLVIGLTTVCFAAAGLRAIVHELTQATTQPVYPAVPPPRFGTQRQPPGAGAGLLFVIPLGLLGLVTTGVALMPVAVMQRIFERFNRPPVTGDRDLGDEFLYGRYGRRRRLGGWWWWWPF